MKGTSIMQIDPTLQPVQQGQVPPGGTFLLGPDNAICMNSDQAPADPAPVPFVRLSDGHIFSTQDRHTPVLPIVFKVVQA